MRIHWAGSYLYEDEMSSFRHQGIERRRSRQEQRLGWWHIRIALYSFLALISIGVAQTAFAADAGKIAASGNSAGAPACSACHGQSGEGRPDAGYPRLAGLSAGYLLHQLNDFASGARSSDIMHPVATALSEDERRAMAAYYDSTQAPKAPGEKKPDQKVLAVGAGLAQRGLWTKDLPACAQCHGPGGQGVGATFPRLAGQSAEYIEAQLKAFKTGKRANDPLHLMTGIAAKLDARQIAAVAAYYAGLELRSAAAEAKGSTP